MKCQPTPDRRVHRLWVRSKADYAHSVPFRPEAAGRGIPKSNVQLQSSLVSADRRERLAGAFGLPMLFDPRQCRDTFPILI